MPMLSNHGSDDDASSEYDSDSGSSVHTIYHNAHDDASHQDGEAHPPPDYSNNFFAPQPSPPPAGHASGHGEKRKAGDSGAEDPARPNGAKTRRLTSPGSDSSASESGASSEAENGYDNGHYDDDSIYPEHDAAVAAPNPAPLIHPAFTKTNGQPKTGAQIWAEQFPGVKITSLARSAILASYPAARVPELARPFKFATKPQNMAAWFIQAAGDLLPAERSCTRCAEGMGVFGRACVVLSDDDKTAGTCANCWYNRMGFCCSVRVGNDASVDWRKRARGPGHMQGGQQGGVVHPAYAEAAAGKVKAASAKAPAATGVEPFPGAGGSPALEADGFFADAAGGGDEALPTTADDLLTSLGHPPSLSVVAAPPRALPPPRQPQPQPQVKHSSSPPTTGVVLANSLDGKVGSWEKRYGNMGTAELEEMQRVLVERLEDTTMRMVAMQKVLAGRQAGKR
ncbi:hypothetical protein QBC39DRAFT_436712 [Podospora conica]|nr:hypothetical protein QBC39DRAFT_436712 [Schizothecium conicum]